MSDLYRICETGEAIRLVKDDDQPDVLTVRRYLGQVSEGDIPDGATLLRVNSERATPSPRTRTPSMTLEEEVERQVPQTTPWPDWLRPELQAALEALDTWYDARKGDRHPAEAALRQVVRALRRARLA